ncbi:MAG: hypothetical protein LBC82_01515 [Oscillospiraceae bacterium]|nr:hypothetical protein [Oscillospiraceae bacterium]
MLVADIMAAVCSGATLAYSFVFINVMLRLPAMITDNTIRASERNIKLLILVTTIIIMFIALVKFISSAGKILYRVLYYKKNPEADGFFARSFVKSGTMRFRFFSVMLNSFIAFYALAMFLLAFPNRMYTVGEGRTARVIGEETHRIWEMRWFLPMLQFFLIMFLIGLAISVLRYKIVSVQKEYEELYAVSRARKPQETTCRICGFENHISSVNCGKCEAKSRGAI